VCASLGIDVEKEAERNAFSPGISDGSRAGKKVASAHVCGGRQIIVARVGWRVGGRGRPGRTGKASRGHRPRASSGRRLRFQGTRGVEASIGTSVSMCVHVPPRGKGKEFPWRRSGGCRRPAPLCPFCHTRHTHPTPPHPTHFRMNAVADALAGRLVYEPTATSLRQRCSSSTCTFGISRSEPLLEITCTVRLGANDPRGGREGGSR
jgi:hypothetical protein